MSIPYVVRKKADLSSGERKELWYGVPSKMQRRGGVKNKELAVRNDLSQTLPCKEDGL